MSAALMGRATWHQGITMPEKMVLVAIADVSDDTGLAYMLIETLMMKSSASRRCVQSALSGLISKGILLRKERRHRSSVFKIVVDSLPLGRPPVSEKEMNDDHFWENIRGAPDAPHEKKVGAANARQGARNAPQGAPDAHILPVETPVLTPEEPPLPSEEATPFVEPELFELASAEEPLEDFVGRRWKELKAKHPGIADIRKIDSGLLHTMKIRAGQHARAGESAIAVWSELLDNVDGSRFLQGRVPPGPGRDVPFKLTLAWASKAANFREILSGKYNADRDEKLFDPTSGRRLGPTGQALRGTLERFRSGRERSRGFGDPRGDNT